MLRKLLLGASIACCLSPLAAAEGTLKMKFVYGGIPPVQAAIPVAARVAGNANVLDETLIVNPQNRGIKNVVLYVYTGHGGSKLPKMDFKTEQHQLQSNRFRYQPHILIMKAGDTLEVTNSGVFDHSFRFNFIRQPAETFALAPKQKFIGQLANAEPAAIPVDSDFYPWMRAYVLILDHPFAAKSNEDGDLEIRGLPTGQELSFRIFIEGAKGAIDEVRINGEPTVWRRNRFSVDIKEGENDLGTIEISPTVFR